MPFSDSTYETITKKKSMAFRNNEGTTLKALSVHRSISYKHDTFDSSHINTHNYSQTSNWSQAISCLIKRMIDIYKDFRCPSCAVRHHCGKIFRCPREKEAYQLHWHWIEVKQLSVVYSRRCIIAGGRGREFGFAVEEATREPSLSVWPLYCSCHPHALPVSH